MTVDQHQALTPAQIEAWTYAALQDGWVLGDPRRPDRRGPWLDSDGDRSLVLTRGELVVWLVDRDSLRYTHEHCPGRAAVRRPGHAVLVGDEWVRTCTETTVRETWTAGWAGFGTVAFDVPVPYDREAIVARLESCPTCGRRVGVARLRPLGFAGKICVDCDRTKPQIRASVEYPGWTE